MSAHADGRDAKRLGSLAAGAVSEALAAVGVHPNNVFIRDLSPAYVEAEIGVFRVEVSTDDLKHPGAVYTVIVT